MNVLVCAQASRTSQQKSVKRFERIASDQVHYIIISSYCHRDGRLVFKLGHSEALLYTSMGYSTSLMFDLHNCQTLFFRLRSREQLMSVPCCPRIPKVVQRKSVLPNMYNLHTHGIFLLNYSTLATKLIPIPCESFDSGYEPSNMKFEFWGHFVVTRGQIRNAPEKS